MAWVLCPPSTPVSPVDRGFSFSPTAAEPAFPQAVPQLEIRCLFIDAELVSLLRLAPVADALTVEEPVASLTYFGHDRSDIDDIEKEASTDAVAQALGSPRFRRKGLAWVILPPSESKKDVCLHEAFRHDASCSRA